jgi:hypothetical protein
LKRSILFACAAICLGLVAGCKKGEPMAAVVNGEAITLDQYYKYMELKPQVQVIVNPATLQAGAGGQLPQQPYNGQVMGSLGLQALNDLVQQAVLRQLAKDEKSYPSEQEITDELSERTKANPSFVRDLTNVGFTIGMIKGDIALQLAQYKLTTQGINITDAEVDRYIAEHPKEFVEPESADMIWMLVTDEQKKIADAELKTGRSFILVAQKYSIAPNTRAMQYRFPEKYIPRLVNFGTDLMPAIQKTPAQQQSAWIKFKEGWAKFFVNKKTAERKLAIDDPMKKRVRRSIALQKGSAGKDVNLRIQEKLRASKIEIMIPHLIEPWKRSIEALQTSSASKGASSSGPGSP